MIIQILNGTIDPSWVITVILGIVGVLLLRMLVKMESRMDKQDERLNKGDARIEVVTRVLLQMLTKLGGEDDSFYDDLRGQLKP